MKFYQVVAQSVSCDRDNCSFLRSYCSALRFL